MTNRPRRSWLAALLTLLEAGLGHMYSGRLKRGIVLFAISYLLFTALAISFTVIAPNKLYMFFAAGIGLAFGVFCVVDAICIANRNKATYTPAKYNRWYLYVAYLVIGLLLAELYSSFIVVPHFAQSYMIPTGSMEPTLLIGDHLLVNKRAYRTGKPKLGDLILFKYPKNPEVAYVKRAIGLPGDKVEMIGRTVYINGEALKEDYTQYIEPGSIYTHYGPFRVPPGQYFVMGDNRDNSQDSRFWGMVPREYLLGKALVIYWSYEMPRNHYLHTSASDRMKKVADFLFNFFSKTRWNRIFQLIE